MEANNKPTDREVIDVMVDGGERLCDYAIGQWVGYKYSENPPTEADNKQRAEFIMRWNYIRRRIRQIAKEWRTK